MSRKKLSREQQKAMFANMNQSSHAKRIDRSINAKTKYSRNNKTGVQEWRQTPNRIDIRGVDTTKSKVTPRTPKKVVNNNELTKEERIHYYKEKKERKLERAEYLAEKHEKESERRYKASHDAVSGIPFGQPILVGHHSERAHRSALRRSDDNMRKSIEHDEKAEHYQKRVKNIESDRVISSDDPEAVDKLKIKLKKQEEEREKYKEYNKKARKEGKDTLPPYVLSNLGQNIRATKQRIEYLESQEKIPETSKTINNVEIKTNKLDNRVEMYFPDKPSPEFRSKLKRNGFRWSPSKSAWQRQLNNSSIYWAEDLAKDYKK